MIPYMEFWKGLKLFLDHQTRCQCQSITISQIDSDMKELVVILCYSTINAIIIFYFKIKELPFMKEGALLGDIMKIILLRQRKLLESWLIIPLFPVGILLGWGEGQMLICCVNLFIYFRLYKVPDGKL